MTYSEKALALEARLNALIGGGWDPVAGPPTLEAPHTLSLAAGWSTVAGQPVPMYMMLPFGLVYTAGAVSHASFSGTTQLSATGALPSAYRPSTEYVVGGGINADIEITAAGTINAITSSTVSAAQWSGIYLLNW